MRTCAFSYCGNRIMFSTDKQMGHACEIFFCDIRDSAQMGKGIRFNHGILAVLFHNAHCYKILKYISVYFRSSVDNILAVPCDYNFFPANQFSGLRTKIM